MRGQHPDGIVLLAHEDEVHLENCLTFEQLGKEFNDYKDDYN